MLEQNSLQQKLNNTYILRFKFGSLHGPLRLQQHADSIAMNLP